MWTDAARERHKDDGRRYPSDLTDAERQTIGPAPRGHATLTADLREMANACLHLEKAGCPWRFLPQEFGPWQTVRTWREPAVSPARPLPGGRHPDRHRWPSHAGGARPAGPGA